MRQITFGLLLFLLATAIAGGGGGGSGGGSADCDPSYEHRDANIRWVSVNPSSYSGGCTVDEWSDFHIDTGGRIYMDFTEDEIDDWPYSLNSPVVITGPGCRKSVRPDLGYPEGFPEAWEGEARWCSAGRADYWERWEIEYDDRNAGFRIGYGFIEVVR